MQATEQVAAKAKEIDGYKFCYPGFNRIRNRVGILAARELVEQVIEVRHKSD